MGIVYQAAFRDFGVERSVAEVEAALGETWREVAARRAAGETWGSGGGPHRFWRRFVAGTLGHLGGGELPEGLLERLVVHFQSHTSWRVYEEVPEVLAALEARGLLLVVVSNWDASLPELLARHQLAGRFHHLVVSAIEGHTKPSRRIFEIALEKAGVLPEEALHVGDSFAEDYEGARNAGIRALLLDRPGRGRPGCETVRTLLDILPLIPTPGN